jgi:hypothetical protein
LFLRKGTIVLIITIIVSFSIRTFGTLFPQIFKNILIVKVTILINSIFIISHLIFWILFYREYISEKKPSLKTICIFAIFGSFAVSAIYLKKLPFVFGLNAHIPLFLLNPYFDALVPLTSSAIHLVFFVSFKQSLTIDEFPILSRPILSIIVGNGLFISLHLIVLLNFISRNRFEWLEHMPRIIAVSTVPLIILAVCFMLYFYYQFYCYLNSNENIEKNST